MKKIRECEEEKGRRTNVDGDEVDDEVEEQGREGEEEEKRKPETEWCSGLTAHGPEE